MVPPETTLIELLPRLRIILSPSSLTNFAISLIAFLGTIPDMLSETASFKLNEAVASLCASVATLVI